MTGNVLFDPGEVSQHSITFDGMTIRTPSPREAWRSRCESGRAEAVDISHLGQPAPVSLSHSSVT